MATAKLEPFQIATANAVLKFLQNRKPPRRYLIADEVGLGKTVVAQEIIRRLMRNRRKHLTVFYVCSNLSIARQNQQKLLELLEGDDPWSAFSQVDRLSLIPVEGPPTHRKLHLYTLTPQTSVPQKTTRPGGRYEERALIYVLFNETWPDLTPRYIPEDKFKLYVSWNNWNREVGNQQQKVQKNPALARAFKKAIRREFQVEHGRRTTTFLRKLDFYEFIWRCRRAMADVALKNIKPDVVIFDEFQRFRYLVDEETGPTESRIINQLRGETGNGRTYLLLLSATPYRLYSNRWDDALKQSHREDFFNLIEFLYGGDEEAIVYRNRCEYAFSRLEEELRLGRLNSREALKARLDAELLLRPIIARTERADIIDGWKTFETTALSLKLDPGDIKIFQHFSKSLDSKHITSAVPFWHSIPMPMQTMGKKYTTWNRASDIPKSDTPFLSSRRRNKFVMPETWPHPRLRKLIDLLDLDAYALPWVAPSKPWWPLESQWENSPEKIILFSRFRAVPQTVSACISYSLESHLFRSSGIKYEALTKNRRLAASENRHNLLALFNPDPWLINTIDPLRSKMRNLDELRSYIKRKLSRELRKLGIHVNRRRSSRPRPVWQILAAINQQTGYFLPVLAAWRSVHQDERRMSKSVDQSKGLASLLDDWESESYNVVQELSPVELDNLINYALGAPGVIVGRALKRHWKECLDSRNIIATVKVSWNSLRTYLDQQWFAAALDGLGDYPAALLKACVSGNLESVLDEHLYITQVLYNQRDRDLANALAMSLTARTSNFFLHQLGNKEGKTFSLRCHVSLPFTESFSIDAITGEEKSYRPEELRRAFNSPFWPHILTTTSIGQEGLDFHVWCKRVMHWDLGYNPVDLEQREGRILRYGGLNIRQGIVKSLRSRGIEPSGTGSPWVLIGKAANKYLHDYSGLSPWWVLEEAESQRYFFDMPLSEEKFHYERLRKQRLIYRLVLGQPDQEDLTDLLAQQGLLDHDEIQESIIQLSPWFSANEIDT